MTTNRGTRGPSGLGRQPGAVHLVLVVCAHDCRTDHDWAALQQDDIRLMHAVDMDDAIAVLIVEPRLDAVVVQGPMPSLAGHTLAQWMDVMPPGAAILIAGADSAGKSTAKIRALMTNQPG